MATPYTVVKVTCLMVAIGVCSMLGYLTPYWEVAEAVENSTTVMIYIGLPYACVSTAAADGPAIPQCTTYLFQVAAKSKNNYSLYTVQWLITIHLVSMIASIPLCMAVILLLSPSSKPRSTSLPANRTASMSSVAHAEQLPPSYASLALPGASLQSRLSSLTMLSSSSSAYSTISMSDQSLKPQPAEPTPVKSVSDNMWSICTHPVCITITVFLHLISTVTGICGVLMFALMDLPDIPILDDLSEAIQSNLADAAYFGISYYLCCAGLCTFFALGLVEACAGVFTLQQSRQLDEAQDPERLPILSNDMLFRHRQFKRFLEVSTSSSSQRSGRYFEWSKVESCHADFIRDV